MNEIDEILARATPEQVIEDSYEHFKVLLIALTTASKMGTPGHAERLTQMRGLIGKMELFHNHLNKPAATEFGGGFRKDLGLIADG